MYQLLTLFWLKWKLLRNSLRSSRAVINQAASVLGMILILSFALAVAAGLGFAAYFLSQPGAMTEAFRRGAATEGFPVSSVEFIFFSILAFLYLMWATIPLSIGSSKQFDAGRMLMYPISLGKLFAIDFLSELTSLQSVFAIPAILAMSIGVGLGSGNLIRPLVAAVPTIVFGVALSKWLSTIVGSLVRQQRARGETIIALVGAIAGIGGALVGQLGPLLLRHADSFRSLRWTPPGAAAFLLTPTNNDPALSLLALLAISAYAAVLVFATYWVARRSALGLGGKRRRKVITETSNVPAYSGWQLPLLSEQLSAVIEKEMRYAMRNAQLRMMALMPLILVVVRLVNSRRWGARPGAAHSSSDFLGYSPGMLPTFGVLYVFMILAGLSCNLFAFEEGGMRTLILSPMERWKVLVGKNLVVTTLAALFSMALLTVNGIVFRDLTPQALLFAGLSFVVFAALMSLIGNWFSITFPKRMQFGKRLNVSGVAGLLLIPMVLFMGLPPFAAVAAGYIFESFLVEYLAIAGCALLAVAFYALIIKFQGDSLERREVEILEAVKEPSE
jgi:hypothetical protein